jgi:hypothetical protein
MKFVESFRNLFTKKINASITKEDLLSSRYIKVYNFHNKREFKEFLEEITLGRVNELLPKILPKKVNIEIKKEIIDCVVIFLKFISIHYDYWPGDYIYNTEFDRIIKFNIEKKIH